MPLNESQKIKALFQRVKSTSGTAVSAAEKEGVARFCSAANVTADESNRFFSNLAILSSKSSGVINSSVDDAIAFLQTEKPTVNMFVSDERVARALDYSGPAPILAELIRDPECPCVPGRVRIVLNLPPRTIVVNGSLSRITDHENPHFTADVEKLLSTLDGIGKVAACATIRDMKVANIMAGPSRMLVDFMEQKKGACDLLILDDLLLSNVKSVVVGRIEDAEKIRGSLMCRGSVVPVVLVESPGSPFPERLVDENDVTTIKAASGAYFQIGEVIVSKPLPSVPKKMGKIVEMLNGKITVEWSDSTRSLHDLMEAMCSFMPCPDMEQIRPNPVYYNLEGMDEQSAVLLSSLGVDPVTLYSLASHARPANENAKGWRTNFLNLMDDYGIHCSTVSGHVNTDEGIRKRSWFEHSLQRGLRLIMDIEHDRINIVAGDCPEYMAPLPAFGFRRE